MPRRPTNASGEYLSLHWENDADTEYVHGHVGARAFFHAVDGHHGGSVDTLDFGTFPAYSTEPRHAWARFVFNGCDEYGNPSRVLREYPEAGRGRFKVTACDPDRWVRHKRCPDEAADGDPCWLREGHGGGHLGATAWRTARSPA